MMADKKRIAEAVVGKMYDNDPFSQWLGIKRVEVNPGDVVLQMTVTKEMLNGFSIAHGGIAYSLADSALAFASNAHGRMAVSVETNISHLLPIKENDVLTASTIEENLNHKIALYTVIVKNQNDEKVALFKGTVYRRSQEWKV